jgi:hypothetical protein
MAQKPLYDDTIHESFLISQHTTKPWYSLCRWEHERGSEDLTAI